MSTASSDVTHEIPKSISARYGMGMQQGKSGSVPKIKGASYAMSMWGRSHKKPTDREDISQSQRVDVRTR